MLNAAPMDSMFAMISLQREGSLSARSFDTVHAAPVGGLDGMAFPRRVVRLMSFSCNPKRFLVVNKSKECNQNQAIVTTRAIGIFQIDTQ